MRYLGSVSGSGVLDPAGASPANASFEFECYAVRAGGVSASGEIIAEDAVLRNLIGQTAAPFVTDAGHKLTLRLSDAKSAPRGGSAHVVVTGDLPVLRGRTLHWPDSAAVE